MRKTIYIDCMLKDNKIVAYHISPNQRTMPHDYYKDFLYAGKSMENCDEIYEVKWMSVEFDENTESKFNNYVFEEVARRFYMQWEIHEEYWGSKPY